MGDEGREDEVLKALFRVVDMAKSNEIESVLVLYRGKRGIGSADNNLTVGEANLLLDAFKSWLLSCYVKGKGSHLR